VFGPSATQKDIYDEAIVPIVDEARAHAHARLQRRTVAPRDTRPTPFCASRCDLHALTLLALRPAHPRPQVLEGFNCTIFAYGQTGTGKTHTMAGDCGAAQGARGVSDAAGVIPRAVAHIFATLEAAQAEYSVKVTFLELYNEEITDLLSADDEDPRAAALRPDAERRKLALMEDGKGGVMVKGLEEVIVSNGAEIFSVLERCAARLRRACACSRVCMYTHMHFASCADGMPPLYASHVTLRQRHGEAAHG
jgi:hypothetical protein